MANARVIVKRRKTVRNVRKITRTMQLIATARFQAAINRATASKPYTEKLGELVAELSGAAEGADHPLLETHEQASGRSVLLAITSHRGLCGGYNSNVLRAAVDHLNRSKEGGVETDVYMCGTKGINYFRFLGYTIRKRITNVSDTPRFEQIERVGKVTVKRLVESHRHADVAATLRAKQRRPVEFDGMS
ncbi:MAG: F0F1 ATP synthase subunit gamma [Planctomycetes bacterium]|nr:F0F1 ATP synthase subunit gamma [Planctomycetota bacterium]